MVINMREEEKRKGAGIGGRGAETSRSTSVVLRYTHVGMLVAVFAVRQRTSALSRRTSEEVLGYLAPNTLSRSCHGQESESISPLPLEG